ncbi:hypothetical protein KJ742_01635 [Patescibacteria group bacterium]|nr:hypothetical protein [Patescibacteria group bacterium]MBU1682625.1 hypothetical protein [Patescibacteria group bacterium]
MKKLFSITITATILILGLIPQISIATTKQARNAQGGESTFVLDVNDVGGDVALQFGETLAESLTWDSANLEFNISDDFSIDGYLDLGDQTEDPSANEGRLWFRSDTDNLMFYADGKTQEIGVIEVGQFYDSDGNGGSFNINTVDWTAIPWDSESFDEDETYSHDTVTNNSQITVNDTGLYKINFSVSHENNTAVRKNIRCAIRINGSTFPNVAADSFSQSGNTTDAWGTNNSSALFSLSTNDYYEIVCKKVGSNNGSAYLTAGSSEGVSWTSIELIRRQ